MEQAVRDALARVLGQPVDARADTPLAALGFDSAAWPALAVALADVAILRDEDVRDVRTFGELLAMVDSCARPS